MMVSQRWVITLEAGDRFADLYAHVSRIRALEPPTFTTAGIVLHVEAPAYVAIAARVPAEHDGPPAERDGRLTLDPGHTRILGMTVWRPR